MNAHLFIYEGFVQFEVVLAAYFIASKGIITTVGIDSTPVTSAEGFKTVPDTSLAEIAPESVEIFIIPGGEPEPLFSVDGLYSLLRDLDDADIKIAAICGGPAHLAKSGVLTGRKFTTSLTLEQYPHFSNATYINSTVVTDGNIITAKANGYVDFALEIGRAMDMYDDDADYKETVRFFKEFKDA